MKPMHEKNRFSEFTFLTRLQKNFTFSNCDKGNPRNHDSVCQVTVADSLSA